MIKQGAKMEWHVLDAGNNTISSVFRTPNNSQTTFIVNNTQYVFDIEQLKEIVDMLSKAIDYKFPNDYITPSTKSEANATESLAKLVTAQEVKQNVRD